MHYKWYGYITNASSYGISTLGCGTLSGFAMALLRLILVLCRVLRLIQNETFLFLFITLVLDIITESSVDFIAYRLSEATMCRYITMQILGASLR